MHSSFERGAQPSRCLAFSLVAFLVLPSSGRMSLIAGSRNEAKRTSQLGNCRVGTLFAASPMRFLSTLAMSRMAMKSPATARNRSPLAAGFVIARKCKSATSRTSTTPK